MMAPSIGSNGVVPETLTQDNYALWSILTKNYLISEDLWNVVIKDGKQGNEVEWDKKNAKALYIIQGSCGQEISHIKEAKTAKSAWNILASLFRSRLQANPDIEQGLTPLQRNVLKHDWDAARSFMSKNRRAVYDTSDTGKTVLHIAILAGNEDVVKKLAKKVPKRLLEERDPKGYTPLALVADLTDSDSIAKCMVDRSDALLSIKTNEGLIPVVLAALKNHQNMTRYLYGETPWSILNEDDGRTSAILLTRCISSEIFDIAMDLLRRNPRLPLYHKFDGVSPLYALAQKPSAFPSGNPLCFLLRWVYNCITRDKKGKAIKIRFQINQGEKTKSAIAGCLWNLWGKCPTPLLRVYLQFPGINQLYKKKETHFQVVEIIRSMAKGIMDYDESERHRASVYESLLEASKSGISEFITLMTQANPELYWVFDENLRGVFSYAILNRREKIFKLIYGLGGQGKVIVSHTDIFGNNLLHFTGMLAPSSELDRKSGPALQMQRELQWFKAVKGILHPKFQQSENGDGMKPDELFTKKHEELVKDGEKWAKETATSFTIVATLIITIMFAAAFTVPGGNNDDGIPIFLNEKMFSVFMVADALSLFASSSSVMIFIGILTSRYAERDFLKSLPLKMMLGLFSLICSVLSMMIAFCAALSLMLRGHLQIVIVAISIASVSVIIFLPFQLRLLFEIFKSTFRSEILSNKNTKI